MAVYYLDSSALVKRYASELGTAWILSLTDPLAGHDLNTLRVTGPEVAAALFRKVRMEQLASSDASRLLADFQADWQARYQIIEVSVAIADQAVSLVERHSLRGYDAVHLAAALGLHVTRAGMGLATLTFVSADTQQLQAAGAEGLPVDDPNLHP